MDLCELQFSLYNRLKCQFQHKEIELFGWKQLINLKAILCVYNQPLYHRQDMAQGQFLSRL